MWTMKRVAVSTFIAWHYQLVCGCYRKLVVAQHFRKVCNTTCLCRKMNAAAVKCSNCLLQLQDAAGLVVARGQRTTGSPLTGLLNELRSLCLPLENEDSRIRSLKSALS